jgi:hypothetical protein
LGKKVLLTPLFVIEQYSRQAIGTEWFFDLRAARRGQIHEQLLLAGEAFKTKAGGSGSRHRCFCETNPILMLRAAPSANGRLIGREEETRKV